MPHGHHENRLEGLDPRELLSRAILAATETVEASPDDLTPSWLTKQRFSQLAMVTMMILLVSLLYFSISKRIRESSEAPATKPAPVVEAKPSNRVIPTINSAPVSGTTSAISPETQEAELHKLEAAASSGDATAQFQLGKRYASGEGVPKDEAKAAGLYRKAAEKGNLEADVELGVFYSNGKIAFHPVNWERVAAAWQIAAENGDPVTQRRLGECYRNGRGVPHDPLKAIEWLQKSAEQGNSIAQWSLAKMYDGSRGVPRDDAKAFKWMEKSALQGYEWALLALAQMYATGTGVSKDPVKAFEWARKAAEKSNPTAQAMLAEMYLKGEGTEKDMANAVALSRKATDQGEIGPQLNLEQIYSSEKAPLETNQLQGFASILKAAEEGSVAAQLGVGYLYLQGKGVQTDGKKGFAWILKSAENGNAQAEALVGDMYESGVFVEKDEVKAAEWRAKASRQKQSLPDVTPLDVGQPQFYDSN